MKIVDLFWEGISIIKQAISWYKGSGKLLELFLIMLVLLLILSEKNSFEHLYVLLFQVSAEPASESCFQILSTKKRKTSVSAFANRSFSFFTC